MSIFTCLWLPLPAVEKLHSYFSDLEKLFTARRNWGSWHHSQPSCVRNDNQLVSESVTDKGSKWSDLGPIKKCSNTWTITTLHCFHCSHLFVWPTWPEFIVNGGPWVRMMWGQREVQVQSGRSTISCSRFLVQFCLSRRLGLNNKKCQKVVKVMTLELLLFGVVLACFFIFSKRWSTQNNILVRAGHVFIIICQASSLNVLSN